MSTENNSDKLYNDSIKILSDLIGFKTISGEDNNSIINSILECQSRKCCAVVTRFLVDLE